MSYKVKTVPTFDKQAKRLARKYPSLKQDLTALSISLLDQPEQGTSLGNSCYKIRLAIKSKGKGKSGGARIITHIHVAEDDIYLLSIYDKSEKDNLNEGELDGLLSEINP